MEPITILCTMTTFVYMGGIFFLGYNLGDYLIKNTFYNNRENPYLIRPRYNNINNLYRYSVH